MNILLMGPQGSGKGTQAKIMASKFGLFYFEAGEFLREIAKTNESLKKIMDSGQLVPDQEMSSYVSAYFDQKNIYDNILFDGYPRDEVQYKMFANWLNAKNAKLDKVIVLEIGEEETIKRLTLRKKIEGRGDDNPEAVKKRLSIYKERTEKLIQEISEKVEVVRVDGERTIDMIAYDLSKIIQNIND